MTSLSVRSRAAAVLGVCVAVCALSAPAAFAADHAVSLTTSRTFSPAALSVAVGDTVTWTWAGDRSHNVTANSGQADTFSSATQTTGTFVKTFSIAGSFTYRCTLHSGMNGTINVLAPGSAPDTTAPSAPTGLVATAGNATVTLDWADSTATDLSNYVVERRVGAGAWSTVGSPTLSTLTDATVTNGTTYSYRVSAVDTSANVSAASAIVSAIVTATPVAATPLPPGAPADRHVAIANYAFGPATITINTGDAVTWDWSGADVNHSVTTTAGQTESFDSHLGALIDAIVGPPAGGTYSHVFTQIGSFPYFCRVHPDMTGAVTVVASGAPVTQPADPPAAPKPAAPAQTVNPARAAKTYNVKVADFTFAPANLSIALGDVVKWNWTGEDTNHSVTATAGQKESFESHPGLKISEVVKAPTGGSFSHEFAHEGTFTYLCRVHPGMTGKVTVGPAPLRVRIVTVKRGTGSLQVSYRLTKRSAVKAMVYKAGKRVVTKSTKGRSGANSLRIVLPKSARRAALKIVLRGGPDGAAQAKLTVRALRPPTPPVPSASASRSSSSPSAVPSSSPRTSSCPSSG